MIICCLYNTCKERTNTIYYPPSSATHSMDLICTLTRLLCTWHTCCRGSCRLGHAQGHFLECRKDFHFEEGSEIHCMHPKRRRKGKSLGIFLKITLLGPYYVLPGEKKRKRKMTYDCFFLAVVLFNSY